jgi:plastocyanin
VVVTIEVKGKEAVPLPKPLDIDQNHCRFEPHVSVVPAGSTVRFLNSDGVSHNVKLNSTRNDALNQTIGAGSSQEHVLSRAENIYIECTLHSWMNSWLFVTDTPHYAVTDGTGSFEIAGLPPGEYTVEVWHEKLGKGKGKATIDAKGKAGPVEIKLGGAKKKRRR